MEITDDLNAKNKIKHVPLLTFADVKWALQGGREKLLSSIFGYVSIFVLIIRDFSLRRFCLSTSADSLTLLPQDSFVFNFQIYKYPCIFV